MTKLGFVDRIIDVLNRRREPVRCRSSTTVEPEPNVTTVKAAPS